MFDSDHDPYPTDGRALRALGFEFTEFEFNERTGVAVSTYERAVYESELDDEPFIEKVERTTYQPAGRDHLNWRWYDGRITIGYDEDTGEPIIE